MVLVLHPTLSIGMCIRVIVRLVTLVGRKLFLFISIKFREGLVWLTCEALVRHLTHHIIIITLGFEPLLAVLVLLVAPSRRLVVISFPEISLKLFFSLTPSSCLYLLHAIYNYFYYIIKLTIGIKLRLIGDSSCVESALAELGIDVFHDNVRLMVHLLNEVFLIVDDVEFIAVVTLIAIFTHLI